MAVTLYYWTTATCSEKKGIILKNQISCMIVLSANSWIKTSIPGIHYRIIFTINFEHFKQM